MTVLLLLFPIFIRFFFVLLYLVPYYAVGNLDLIIHCHDLDGCVGLYAYWSQQSSEWQGLALYSVSHFLGVLIFPVELVIQTEPDVNGNDIAVSSCCEWVYTRPASGTVPRNAFLCGLRHEFWPARFCNALQYRTFDGYDILANVAGSISGLSLAFLLDYCVAMRREHRRRWGGKREAEYQRALMDESDLEDDLEHDTAYPASYIEREHELEPLSRTT